MTRRRFVVMGAFTGFFIGLLLGAFLASWSWTSELAGFEWDEVGLMPVAAAFGAAIFCSVAGAVLVFDYGNRGNPPPSAD